MLHPPQVYKQRTEEEQVPSTSLSPMEESTQQAPHQDRKQKKRKSNSGNVYGKNLLLRETRVIWRHLGQPDRGEPRAAHSRLPARETTSLRGLWLIDGQIGATWKGARWSSQKSEPEPLSSSSSGKSSSGNSSSSPSPSSEASSASGGLGGATEGVGAGCRKAGAAQVKDGQSERSTGASHPARFCGTVRNLQAKESKRTESSRRNAGVLAMAAPKASSHLVRECLAGTTPILQMRSTPEPYCTKRNPG
jgi:hypothetical protein